MFVRNINFKIRLTNKFAQMSKELTEKLNNQVRSVLEVYDRARENLGDKIPEVAIPTIVVVGDQSSGKSSVLESIS